MALLVLGFAIRIGVAFYWQNTLDQEGKLFRFGDSDSYWVMGASIADGKPYQYGGPNSRIFRSPMYPLMLSIWAHGDLKEARYAEVMSARIAGCALGVIAIAMVMYCAVQLRGPIAGLFAGATAVLYPGAVGMSIFILSEAICVPCMIASIATAFIALRRLSGCSSKNVVSEVPQLEAIRIVTPARFAPVLAWMLLSGLFTGAACLARPSWSLWPVFLFLYLTIACGCSSAWRTTERSRKREWMDHVLSMTAFAVGVFAIMAPWWIRNYQITGKFVPTTLQVGASLYDGWHAGASGSSDENMDFVLPFIYEQLAEDEELAKQGKALESTFEWRLDRRMRNAAIDWAMKNPSDVGKLGLIKLAKTWSPMPVARELGSKWVRLAEGFGYLVIVLMGLVGALAELRRKGAWLFALPCLYFAVIHMIFIGSVRYRQPAILILCVLAGVGCCCFLEWIRNKTGYGFQEPSSDSTSDRSGHSA